MYRKHHNGQLSIEEFHVPFGGTLDPENRWVLFATLMPSDEIEKAYAPQFSPTIGAPAKPARLAFGALFIKQRLGLSDEETVEQIRENAYMQFFLGFAGYSSKTPFDPSMMVHFRKRFSEENLNRITELIVERGKAMVMEAVASAAEEHKSDDPGADADNQLSLDDLVKNGQVLEAIVHVMIAAKRAQTSLMLLNRRSLVAVKSQQQFADNSNTCSEI